MAAPQLQRFLLASGTGLDTAPSADLAEKARGHIIETGRAFQPDIAAALDAGADALICPMVNTREDAQKLVAYTSYAPRGTRSFGPVRASLYGGPDYFKHANDTLITMAMIETKQAVKNIDAILDVEGIAGIYVGPSDLGLSYGLAAKLDRDEPVACDGQDAVAIGEEDEAKGCDPRPPERPCFRLLSRHRLRRRRRGGERGAARGQRDCSQRSRWP